MSGLGRLRGRLPLVVFLMLAVIVLMLVGFACACLSDHPMQAIERALGAIPAAPAISEAWPATVLVLFAGAALILGHRVVQALTPARLQRFLF